MRHLGLLIAAIMAMAGAAAAAQTPGAGIRPMAEYRQEVSVGPRGERIFVYASTRLDRPDPKITRVLIVVHGAGRNADDYFRSAMAAAYLSAGLDNTLIIPPRFGAAAGDCRDDGLADAELTWTCDSWKFGEPSLADNAADSFQVIDKLIGAALDVRRFPHVTKLVILGHSAGAQFVSRYAAVNMIDETLRIRPTYVAANASSYAYLDDYRPLRPEDATRQTSQLTSASSGRLDATLTRVEDPRGCSDFNRWPYGVADRKGYAAAVDLDQMKRNLATRDIILLGGQLDNAPLSGFDTSCPANFQGDSRLDRAINFDRYIREHLNGHSQFEIIPLCGHNERCMFTSPIAASIIFPDVTAKGATPASSRKP